MNINCYRPGANGAPAIVSANFLGDLWSRLDSYEDSISATQGFESLTLRLTTDLEEARDFLDQWLGVAVEVWSDDATRTWEGRVVGVELSAAGRARSRSLDPVQNRIRVRYTTVLGTPGASTALSDATSIARYGRRDGVVSVGGTDATSAANLTAEVLVDRALPRATGTAEAALQASTTAAGAVQVTLVCAGWYESLGNIFIERTDATREATTLQIAYLLSQAASANPFISTAPTITGTGIEYTRAIAADTTIRQALETRLGQPTTAGERWAWGVYDGRVFVARPWAGATPDTATYRIAFDSGEVLTPGGAVIPWWAVRPDAMLEDADLLSVATPAGAIDASDRMYVERVTRRVDASGIVVAFEPAASTGLDARIARLT